LQAIGVHGLYALGLSTVDVLDGFGERFGERAAVTHGDGHDALVGPQHRSTPVRPLGLLGCHASHHTVASQHRCHIAHIRPLYFPSPLHVLLAVERHYGVEALQTEG
jgi:hypothetical protein